MSPGRSGAVPLAYLGGPEPRPDAAMTEAVRRGDVLAGLPRRRVHPLGGVRREVGRGTATACAGRTFPRFVRAAARVT